MNTSVKHRQNRDVLPPPTTPLLPSWRVLLCRTVIDDRSRSVRCQRRGRPRLAWRERRRLWCDHPNWTRLLSKPRVSIIWAYLGIMTVSHVLNWVGPAWWTNFTTQPVVEALGVVMSVAFAAAVILMCWSHWVLVERDAYVLGRQCPACEYDIGELKPDPDGCTVCPECGGAWRLPEVQRG